MRKGLFWVVDESDKPLLLTFAAECDENGSLCSGQMPYNSRKGDSYTHKQSWEIAAKDSSRVIRNKQWNYFPRGRVEIRNGKAIVFHNPTLGEWHEFQAVIVREFELDNIPVRFVPDGSKHYQRGDFM